MQTSVSLKRAWEARVLAGDLRQTPELSDAGLMIGATTILRRCRDDGARDQEWDRSVVLLAVAYGDSAATKLPRMDKALACWRGGEKALANIHLAFVRLPPLHDLDAAYRLYLADLALDAGLAPQTLLKELGLSESVSGFLKFNPGQARVPGGQGSTSGQWTSEVATVQTERRAQTSLFHPVFFNDRKEGPATEVLEEERHIWGTETIDEAIQHHRPVPLLPTFPGGGPARAPTSGPSSGGPRLPSRNPTLDAGTGGDDGEPRREEARSCPPHEDDIERGNSDFGKAFEKTIGAFVNPNDPTPEGQAYFLPLPDPKPRGKPRVSYDDCVQGDGTPGLPGSKRGDMIEAKNKTYDFLLTNPFEKEPTPMDKLADQVGRQNRAVEGTGRHIYYCFEGEKGANIAREKFGEHYKSSSFLVCPPALHKRRDAMTDRGRQRIRALWPARAETPALIAARFRHLIALFQKIDPLLERWFYWLNKYEYISLDRPGLDLPYLIEKRPSRNEEDEPEPWWGYHFDARTECDYDRPTNFEITMKTGSEVSHNWFDMVAYPTVPIRYPLIKAAMIAVSEAFEPQWCEASPCDFFRDPNMSRCSRPPMLPSWMINLPPEIAKLVTPPPDTISEVGADGSLFMAATEEIFDETNPAHIAAAMKIWTVIDPLNFIVPFET